MNNNTPPWGEATEQPDTTEYTIQELREEIEKLKLHSLDYAIWCKFPKQGLFKNLTVQVHRSEGALPKGQLVQFWSNKKEKMLHMVIVDMISQSGDWNYYSVDWYRRED